MIRKPVGLTAPYRRDDDDDIQDYKKPWVGLTEDEAFACQRRDYFETYKAIEEALRRKNNA